MGCLKSVFIEHFVIEKIIKHELNFTLNNWYEWIMHL